MSQTAGNHEEQTEGQFQKWIKDLIQKIRNKMPKAINKLTLLAILTLVISAFILHGLCQTNPNDYYE